jgi:hypothetical protein
MEVFDLRVMCDVKRLVRIALQRVQPARRDVRMPGEHVAATCRDVSQVTQSGLQYRGKASQAMLFKQAQTALNVSDSIGRD